MRGPLFEISQFGKRGEFILSEVVVHEVINKIVERILQEFPGLISKRHKGLLRLALPEKIVDQLSEIDRSYLMEGVTTQVHNFIRESGAKIIPASDADAGELFGLYVNMKPPFSHRKKEEFPDAIALLGLEKWASKRGAKIVVASQDGDWLLFCEKSEHFTCFDSVPKAISAMRGPSRKALDYVIATLEAYQNEKDHHWAELKAYIGNYAENKFHPQIESDFDAVVELKRMSVLSMTLAHDKKRGEWEILNEDEDGISFIFYVEVKLKYEALVSARTYGIGHDEGHFISSHEISGDWENEIEVFAHLTYRAHADGSKLGYGRINGLTICPDLGVIPPLPMDTL